MAFAVILLSLLCLGIAQGQNVGYIDSIRVIEKAKNEIREQLMSMHGQVPNFTDPRRHYAVIISHMMGVGVALAENSSSVYEDVYVDLLPTSFVDGFTNVEGLIKAVKNEHQLYDNDVKKIVDLTNTLCPKSWNDVICNRAVDVMVKVDADKYKQPAKLLLAGGAMAAAFLDADLRSVANSYGEINFLINNIDNLKEFLYTMAKRIRNVHNLN